ncbi:hypothetical protein LINGRAHAP2_LOCUS18081 [Linum grandiflorum]
MDEVWERRPWLISDTMMVVQKWDGRGEPEEVQVDTGDLWVRVHNLPPTHRNKENMKLMGGMFRYYLDIPEVGLEGEGWTRYQKMMVGADLHAPLPTGCTMNLNGTVVQITFEYEKVSDRCDYCKRIGHQIRGCQWRKDDEGRCEEIARRKGKGVATDVGMLGRRLEEDSPLLSPPSASIKTPTRHQLKIFFPALNREMRLETIKPWNLEESMEKLAVTPPLSQIKNLDGPGQHKEAHQAFLAHMLSYGFLLDPSLETTQLSGPMGPIMKETQISKKKEPWQETSHYSNGLVCPSASHTISNKHGKKSSRTKKVVNAPSFTRESQNRGGEKESTEESTEVQTEGGGTVAYPEPPLNP